MDGIQQRPSFPQGSNNEAVAGEPPAPPHQVTEPSGPNRGELRPSDQIERQRRPIDPTLRDRVPARPGPSPGEHRENGGYQLRRQGPQPGPTPAD